MSNRALGNSFESELCDKLYHYGFWTHNMTQNKAGQPADVIAVKNGKAYLIDAKVCSDGKFPLSRIEENQELAMTLWKECGNEQGWFALKVQEKVYMVSHTVVIALKNRQSVLSFDDITKVGIPFERWVSKCK